MIYALVKIMQNVVSLAMEAEVGAAFLTAKEACAMRVALEEMGHPQPSTLLMVDNQTAVRFANDQIKHRHSKAINMRFHWIKDCTRKGHFVVFWSPEKKKKQPGQLCLQAPPTNPSHCHATRFFPQNPTLCKSLNLESPSRV